MSGIIINLIGGFTMGKIFIGYKYDTDNGNIEFATNCRLDDISLQTGYLMCSMAKYYNLSITELAEVIENSLRWEAKKKKRH